MAEQISKNRNAITLGIAVALVATLLAYSLGWFGPATHNPEPVNTKTRTAEASDQVGMKPGEDNVTLKTTKPTGQTTE